MFSNVQVSTEKPLSKIWFRNVHFPNLEFPETEPTLSKLGNVSIFETVFQKFRQNYKPSYLTVAWFTKIDVG